jgi:hypothetical protein
MSIIRMILWGLNPDSDDAPPLELNLTLDEIPPLPTCNKDNSYIEEEKTLPLTRAHQFLNSITSFIGLISHFDNPDLTLYYTLTWKQIDSEQPRKVGEHVLYITVFDHKERTTRIYTRDGGTDRFYSTGSDVPDFDIQHGLVEVKLGQEIDSKADPIAGDSDTISSLRKHYQSILDPICHSMGKPSQNRVYTIENGWTMKMSDTQRKGGEKRGHETGEGAEENEDNFHMRDCEYLQQGSIEGMLRSRYETRGEWIEMYMAMVIKEAMKQFKGEMERQVDGQMTLSTSDEENWKKNLDRNMKFMLRQEQQWMEMLLLNEVETWEERLRNKVVKFIGDIRVPVGENRRLISEWGANCSKRLDANIRAFDARLAADNTKFLKALTRTPIFVKLGSRPSNRSLKIPHPRSEWIAYEQGWKRLEQMTSLLISQCHRSSGVRR